MQITKPDRTIAAVSTPPGEGGIAVIRISGKDAVRVAGKVFKPRHEGKAFEHAKALFGSIVHENQVIDQGFAIYFKAPDSYTGEEMVEISCHGGRFVTQKALDLILAAGAEPAEPGEFTRRAFLNNKIDLVQAEAVCALIQADTERSYHLAQQQLSGRLSSHFTSLKQELQEMLTLLEANIDFAEDDIQLFDRKAMRDKINHTLERLRSMLASYDQGRLLAGGVRVAIAGPPNAGKSSLMNALCDKERVIVDEHPGTTRDLVEETIAVAGQKITLIDTAGIRKGRSRAEAKGIALARKAAEEADVALIVFDASAKTPPSILKAFKALPCREKIFILNKADLKQSIVQGKALSGLPVSAKTGQGIPEIKEAILTKVNRGQSAGEGIIITSLRQKNCLKAASASLTRSVKLLDKKAGEELLALEIRSALNAMSSVIGEVTDDDILNQIFENFCIGK